MKVIGIIPARGGSKGIAKKNLAPCNGKPLIYWTIREAKRSSLDVLYVSTDCQRIADYADGEGVEVLWRPANLATDTARTVDALRWHLEHNLRAKRPDAVFTLQPTNPLRTSLVIDNACELLEDHPEHDAVVSYRRAEEYPERMVFISGDTITKPAFAEAAVGTPRQQLPQYYSRTGEVYLTRTNALSYGIEGRSHFPMILDDVFDIDKPKHLVIVEALMKARGA